MKTECIPTDKKPILSNYLNETMFCMDSDKAEEFDSLVDSFFMLILLKHGLKIVKETRQGCTFSIFARNEEKAILSFRIDCRFKEEVDSWHWELNEMSLFLLKEIGFKISVNLKYNFSLSDYGNDYYFVAQNERAMLEMMREVVKGL